MTTNQDSGKKEPRPYAKVTSIRPVVRDGWYNAFTDLAYWKDYFWLSYARCLGHHVERTVNATSGNTKCPHGRRDGFPEISRKYR